MKKSVSATLFVAIILIGWLTSFWITRSRAIANWQQENPVWLQNASDEIIQNEDTFCQWIDQTTQTLKRQQIELGRLLERSESTDQAIGAQADLIALTHAELLRGVGQHLKSMRSALPDCQKKMLTEFCLQTLRGPMHRLGRGQQAQSCGQQNQSGSSGFGKGFGRGRRQGCCGLTKKLQLTEEQIALAAQEDPTFETDVHQLQSQLLSERQTLLALLENQQEPNGQVTQQIERIINAHQALEKRLIGYVLIMRQHFTADQQKRLIGLCRKNCSNS